MRDEIVAAIDSRHAGEDAGEVVAGRPNGVPVVADFDEAFERFEPEALYLGAATVGGTLPEWFEATLRAGLEKGLVVYNGLHRFFSDEPEYRRLAATHGARIVDVRKPPDDLSVAHGDVFDLDVPRVLVMGTDCAVGKRMTVVELVQAARKRGIDAGFVATGQTGCMIGADAGAVVDRIPADFAAGAVERMVCDVAAMGKDVVFVYGQASLLHPAYSGVALAILHGTAPDAVILQTDPARSQRTLFDHPAYRIAPILEEIELIERIGTGKVVALAVNGKDCKDVEAECEALRQKTGLLAVDPLAQPVGPLLDSVLEFIEKVKAGSERKIAA
jgi:uncharacterized NAD-dependent epimerase/dehydratase family protein